MAETAVAVTTLTAGTVSADLITTAEGGTSVGAADTALINVENVTDTVIVSFYGSGATTATPIAGDYPLAVRSGLGNGTAQTIPANDLVIMVLDASRYMHDDGKIRVLIGANASVVGAHRIPKTI